MNRYGPVIVIEDDKDDRELFLQTYKRLPYRNELIFFENGRKALDYLNSSDTKPFLVISDINMPMMDGFELRDKIRQDADLYHKCIPYLFFSTSSSLQTVVNAYGQSVQGFFVKPVSIRKLEKTIDTIMSYWSMCISPNSYFNQF